MIKLTVATKMSFEQEIIEKIETIIGVTVSVKLQCNYVNVMVANQLVIRVFPNSETFINTSFCVEDLMINVLKLEEFKLLIEDTFNTQIYEGMCER